MSGKQVELENVKRALMPELELIKDKDLREKAVRAWALACQMGGYSRLEDVPTEAFELMPDVSNVQHQKGSARIAHALTRTLRDLEVYLNEDYCVTGALCHDLGKPVEWREGQSGVFAITQGLGVFYGKNPKMPTLRENSSYQVARHSVWGLHIALTVGMPEHVAHIIGAHSREGDLLLRSPEAWIVRYADEIWWAEVAPKHIKGESSGLIPERLESALSHIREIDWRRGPESSRRHRGQN